MKSSVIERVTTKAKEIRKLGLKAEIIRFSLYEGPYIIVENCVELWLDKDMNWVIEFKLRYHE